MKSIICKLMIFIILFLFHQNIVLSATENKTSNTNTINEVSATVVFSENKKNELYFSTNTNTVLENDDFKIPEDTKERIQTALKEKKEKTTIKMTTSTPMSISENDIDILAKIIYAEARGESYAGKLAVGAVVLNRVKSSRYPNTIRSVVFAPGQFSPIKDGSYNRAKPGDEEYKAAREALAGNDPTHGALTFYAYKYTKSSYHESLTHTATIGNHKFFK